jgi:hypothetical protein
MLLSTLIDKYELANDLKPSSISQLRWTVRAFSKHLGHEATVADLTADAINAHLKALRDAGRQPSTVRGRRINLVTLWKFARKTHYLAERPTGVRKIKVPRKPPSAWTQEQVQHLLEVVATFQGTLPTGHKAATYWRAYLMAGWDTGLRRCDLVKLSAADVSSDGFYKTTQEKTGDVIVCQLRPETLTALAALGPIGLHWPGRIEVWYRHFRRLLVLAKLDGKPKWLRRASATAVELDHPGQGSRHLGHRTPGLAEKHYLDQSILARSKPQPPRLA